MRSMSSEGERAKLDIDNKRRMSTPRTPRERVPYSAIVDRPALVLPDDARMIVWTIVNVEDWGIERPMPRTVLSPPMGQPLLPDLPNWAWHEYGMRVGFWRLFDCMQKFSVTPTLAINGVVCRNYPRIAQAAKDAGWEFMGHGWLQQPLHQVEDQRAAIRETMDAIRAFTGRPPRGWESPGLAETFDTIDYLAEAGIEYVADWVLDDQPVYIATAYGPVLSVPYTVEIRSRAGKITREYFVAGGRERDRAASPLAEGFARLRDPAAIRTLGGVGRGPRMRERIEDHAAPWRVRVRVQVGERRRKRGAKTVERTGKRKDLERDHGADALGLAQGNVKSTALLESTTTPMTRPSRDTVRSLIVPPTPSSSPAPSAGAKTRSLSVPSSTATRCPMTRRRPSTRGAVHLAVPSGPIAASDVWSSR